jgi:hypothetical protein
MRKLQNLNNRFNYFTNIRRRCGNNISEFNSIFLFIYPFMDGKQYLNVFLTFIKKIEYTVEVARKHGSSIRNLYL